MRIEIFLTTHQWGDGGYHLTPFRIVVGMLVGTLPIIVTGLLLKKTGNG